MQPTLFKGSANHAQKKKYVFIFIVMQPTLSKGSANHARYLKIKILILFLLHNRHHSYNKLMLSILDKVIFSV